MKHPAWTAVAALSLAAAVVVGAAAQSENADNALEIRRLLMKFDAAQATAPFRYPTACVAGTALEYTQIALNAGLEGAGGGQVDLKTVPEHFARVDHPQPDRQSGRCAYDVSSAGSVAEDHVIADFFSRRRPRTGEIAFVKVWRQGSHQAVLVTFPNGPRGMNPDIGVKAVPVDAQPGVKP